ncbi:cation-translocating P-type ATPase [Taibaiella helva]|uniref:cation-translocating P-type ATPase n=1 Tax=Taibaiella helva TaxID=2301235 RepID=UPI000E56C054|nr:cation-translocating P-type ATPase [Taibaiella helva]
MFLPTIPEAEGLTDQMVEAARVQYGSNELSYKKEHRLIIFLRSIIGEPMIILLLAAALIYAINGALADSFFLLAAILLVATISWYQERRSRNALNALKKLSQPLCKVIRSGSERAVGSDELVVGDIIIMEEGSIVPADGVIIHANDFSVNESMLTGESLPVFKNTVLEDHFVYRGTMVTSGQALVRITATGNRTRLGTIGKSLERIGNERSPLETRMRNFVRKMAVVGGVVFLAIWGINYWRNAEFLDSLLKSLTLAMSILPEEIPVAFTSFMALAAMRLMRKRIVVKQIKTVETLGSATVICTDKTGTITRNKMTLAAIYEAGSAQIQDPGAPLNEAECELIRMAMWASEPLPFDPMDIALHEAYARLFAEDERAVYTMIHEYPLSGKPPMMTHVFGDSSGHRIIAAKGAPEALIDVCGLDEGNKERAYAAIDRLAQQGYRVLGVGSAIYPGNEFPQQQQDLPFSFMGLVAFSDPPKENIDAVLKDFYKAGIEVKIITGDNEITTRSIARSIGLQGYDRSIGGAELMKMNDHDLERCVSDKMIFTRMFPEAKLRVINALKRTGAIVAMTGDGINDGPALKAAHIGIAMGKKGTEIARQAAALVLLDDDLTGMVEAIAMGRRIYTNLKKAIRYIISIHIPIILTVLVPLLFNWRYPNILSPVHVIFLELIMGPTCSVIYENEPMEPNAMQQKPRPYSADLFNFSELALSIVQGLVIALAVLASYWYGVFRGYDIAAVRTLVFITLVSANIMLTLINRSFYYPVWATLRYKNRMIPFIIGLTITLVVLVIWLLPVRNFFGLTLLPLSELCGSILLGLCSVAWLECLKWLRRKKTLSDDHYISA